MTVPLIEYKKFFSDYNRKNPTAITTEEAQMNAVMNFIVFLVLLLAALFGAILQLNDALIQADMERFFFWTRIAVCIAAFPTVFYFSLLTLRVLESEQ
jgi:hypothetical protein